MPPLHLLLPPPLLIIVQSRDPPTLLSWSLCNSPTRNIVSNYTYCLPVPWTTLWYLQPATYLPHSRCLHLHYIPPVETSLKNKSQSQSLGEAKSLKSILRRSVQSTRLPPPTILHSHANIAIGFTHSLHYCQLIASHRHRSSFQPFINPRRSLTVLIT
ncbi:hypothetical protein J1614_005054 [Plenodomus biglobosus]|nr:hypothetical protein J1614_005054 [Plenodomus biglobosus]